MFRIKHFAVVATVAAVLAPAAPAAGRPDDEHRYMGGHADAIDRDIRSKSGSQLDVRSPDRNSAARQWTQPDAVDRALMNRDAMTPDALERYLTNHAQSTQPVDFRSADTRDAALGRYPQSAPVLVSVPGGFDRGEATFGAGATAAALLLAAAIAIAVRQRRRVVLP